MHLDSFCTVLGCLLLPLFMMALLFAFAGVGAEVIVKAVMSITVAIIEGIVKIMLAAISAVSDALTKHKK